jgi:hemerythrin superfamily protein
VDAITLLKDDHRTVERLFKQFEQAGDRAHVRKRQIVDRIIEELSVHAAIEEQAFYPVARAAVPETEDVALESLEEHHIVKWTLSELVDMDPESERFDAKVTVLMENVRHHVEEEESEFFPKVRDRLSRKELAELGDALADAKRSAPTRPHPRMPDSGPVNAVAGAIAGAADRVGDNLSGIAQGSVTAIQDLIARLTGSDRPDVSPTGSSRTRRRAASVRSAASNATGGKQNTARNGKSATTRTAKQTADSGTARAAKKAASGTTRTTKKPASGTPRTAKKAVSTTARTAKKSAAGTKRAATAARSGTTRTANSAQKSARSTAKSGKRAASKTAAAASSSR